LYYSDSGNYYEPDGALYVVRPNGVTELFHPGPLAFPNGVAIDAGEQHLYVALSTAPSIVRLPLNKSVAKPEIVVEFETGIVPDGVAFAADGRMVVACYAPDRILIVEPAGRVELLMDDPGADLLNRPTNVALRDGKVYFANLGGWHIGAFDVAGLKAQPLRYPIF
jgi:sugar lactone lactonase YvrE